MSYCSTSSPWRPFSRFSEGRSPTEAAAVVPRTVSGHRAPNPAFLAEGRTTTPTIRPDDPDDPLQRNKSRMSHLVINYLLINVQQQQKKIRILWDRIQFLRTTHKCWIRVVRNRWGFSEAEWSFLTFFSELQGKPSSSVHRQQRHDIFVPSVLLLFFPPLPPLLLMLAGFRRCRWSRGSERFLNNRFGSWTLRRLTCGSLSCDVSSPLPRLCLGSLSRFCDENLRNKCF